MEDPFFFYLAYAGTGPSLLLESARKTAHTGRYSIVAKDPFLLLRHEKGQLWLEHPRTGKKERRREDPFELLKKLLRKHAVPHSPGMPPFPAGAAGFAGYECKDWLEPCLSGRQATAAGKAPKPRPLPDMYFLFFDRCLVWDHAERVFFLCHYRHAGQDTSLGQFEREVQKAASRSKKHPAAFKPQRGMRLERSFEEKDFRRAVQATQEHIRRGDIFQANLAQRFSFRLDKKPREVYSRLRAINPSPFFGVLDGGDFQLISGSPERLLKLQGRSLETRPIAGTRWRGKSAREDRRLALELLLSDKERAEHIMLVDLERNDLGRVAEYGSVIVDELMTLEDYSHVKHIVSNVRATLREGLDAVDAFRAFFPGGTITGAPKVRCMQIIEDLEPVARGPYTGSLGYFSLTGNMDFNILIRSLVVRGRHAFLHVGAGIVADSEPTKEYHETLHKAEAVLSAVFGPAQVRAFFRRCGLRAGASR